MENGADISQELHLSPEDGNESVSSASPVQFSWTPKIVIANRKSNFFWISEQNKLSITFS